MNNFIKYPRTFHLPWSEGCTSDDKILPNIDCFKNKQVIVTLKMDGENTSLYHNGTHARSINSGNHESRNWVKQLQNNIGYKLDPNVRICGENLYAKHSIHYKSLDSYFMVFSMWEGDLCWDWSKTLLKAQELGLTMVPVIYQGVFDKTQIEKAFLPYKQDHEGYVIRLEESFNIKQFSSAVAKYVRKNHVQTSEHWMNQELIKNEIKKE